MIILKGQVLHTTHCYTKHSHKKRRVQKERQQKKAKYISIKQRKTIISCTKLSSLQGLQGKQRFERHRWVVAILLYSGGSRPSDKVGGAPCHPDPEIRGGGQVSKKNFSALRAWPQFDLKIRGGLGLPSSSPRSATLIYKVGHWP